MVLKPPSGTILLSLVPANVRHADDALALTLILKNHIPRSLLFTCEFIGYNNGIK